MQLIDLAYLDSKTLQYSPRLLIAAIMYLVLGRRFGQFTTEYIVSEISECNYNLFDSGIAFNEYFMSYLVTRLWFCFA